MKQRIISTTHIIALLLIAVLATTIVSPWQAARAAPAGPGAVIAWNAIMVRTVITAGQQPPPPSFVYATYVQAAVYNAVVAIEGGYQPYKSNLGRHPGASVDAAVATAAYKVLVNYFPLQQAALNTDYSTFMASIPDDEAKMEGTDVGHVAADELIALRTGDGLNADIGFSMPAPAPGVWQLPAGVNPQTPWMSKLRPFMLESPDQFRPGPPPDLSSDEWAQEFNEMLLYGRRDSTVRTPEQTTIARFWSSIPLVQYNLAYQGIANARGLSALETARLMAMGDMVGADALIGCFDAKYHYLFWRPAFAIPLGDADGNLNTAGDPTFVPLLPTPPHPEYPAAHGCETSAQAEVFTEFLGTQHINVDVPSTVAGIGPRHFTDANDLTQEIINARVWGGLHFRESAVTGVNLGRKIAHWCSSSTSCRRIDHLFQVASINNERTHGIGKCVRSWGKELDMSIEVDKKDMINTQQMEVAVNGPDGATHLILCAGVANLDSVTHDTYTFFVGSQLSRRQFVGAIASGAISTIQTENKKLIRNATALNLEVNIVCMNAQFDEQSGQVKVTAEVCCNTSMTKLAISYNVALLAELLIY